MEFIYPFLVAFMLVFISELGDKTQLLALSFSTKLKIYIILLGVALGSFLSHGIAILFGSALGNLQNDNFHFMLEIITNISFIIFGIITFFPKKEEINEKDDKSSKIKKLGLNYIFIIAFSIMVGELGDKTFLASIGLGINYPNYKILLIAGAILGMVVSDLIAIILGKLISSKIQEKTIQKLSGIIFILFGLIGFVQMLT